MGKKSRNSKKRDRRGSALRRKHSESIAPNLQTDRKKRISQARTIRGQLQTQLNKVARLRRHGDISQSDRLLEALEYMDPFDPRILHLKAEFERQDGNFAEAEELLADAIEENPKLHRVWHCLGDIKRATKDFVTATFAYETAQKIRPNRMQTLRGLAICYASSGHIALQNRELDIAEAYFKEALRIDADTISIYSGLTYLALQRKDTTSARVYATQLLRVNPNHQNAQDVIKKYGRTTVGYGIYDNGLARALGVK